MLKRQEESSLSSSRRQSAAAATPPPSETHHAKAIGCMSGIFQLFSKYQNPNKRLTFGRKQEKLKPPSPTKPQKSRKDHKPEKQKTFEDTLAVKVQRSPTLPPEIRRSSSAAVVPENPRTPPSSSLVARLMGLDLEGLSAAEKKTPPPPPAAEDRVTEKRRRLLQALEKCNEDLEALKRIIKAVQGADVRTQTPAEETSIPTGVAEELSRTRQIISTAAGATRAPQQRKPIAAKKPGEDDESITKPLNKSIIVNSESSLHRRRQAAAAAITPPWCSQAMVKSVEEVCGEIGWGEKREIGRMGLMLQDLLCRELIEELVRELTKSCSIDHPLPFDACKRRLCFK